MKPTKLYYASDILRFHHRIFNYSLSLLVPLPALWQGCRPVANSRQHFLLFVLLLPCGGGALPGAYCIKPLTQSSNLYNSQTGKSLQLSLLLEVSQQTVITVSFFFP